MIIADVNLNGAVISFFIFAFIFNFIFNSIAMSGVLHLGGRAKDGSVKSTMHTTQLATEDYAIQNSGNYPADTINFSSSIPAGGIGVNYTNPYNSAQPAIVPGIPTQRGQIGYEHSGYDSSAYTIYGYGRDGLFKNAAGATFTLSKKDRRN